MLLILASFLVLVLVFFLALALAFFLVLTLVLIAVFIAILVSVLYLAHRAAARDTADQILIILCLFSHLSGFDSDAAAFLLGHAGLGYAVAAETQEHGWILGKNTVLIFGDVA